MSQDCWGPSSEDYKVYGEIMLAAEKERNEQIQKCRENVERLLGPDKIQVSAFVDMLSKELDVPKSVARVSLWSLLSEGIITLDVKARVSL